MSKLTLKQKIILLIATLGAILILIFQQGLYGKPAASPLPTPKPEAKQNQVNQNEEPTVISTQPSPLEEATILPTQTVEITFNLPLENTGEFKNKIEPEADYEVKLSNDRKTVQIIPKKTFKLGASYTLFIKPDTKFDGSKTLNKELIFHFRTIEYRGI